MSTLTTILSTLVAIEFIYIMYIETIATTSATTSRVFKMTKEELSRKSVNTLFKNQGVYNGLIGLFLLYSVYFSNNGKELTTIFLIYVVLVAGYGALTSDKKIILTQGGLAILALLSMIF